MAHCKIDETHKRMAHRLVRLRLKAALDTRVICMKVITFEKFLEYAVVRWSADIGDTIFSVAIVLLVTHVSA